jgi:2-oxoglutarate ferredoxin oxidoreductase subunit alpha
VTTETRSPLGDLDQIDDLNLVISGQGGDGSLTVATLLAELLTHRGLSVYTERDVLSRIKGGYAAALLRASRQERQVIGDQLQLAIAFEQLGVRRALDHLAPDATVIFDTSEGPLPDDLLPPGVRILGVPFGRLAVQHMGRTLYKNSIAMGLATRVLGIDDDDVRESFTNRFSRLKAPILKNNLQALDIAFEHADELGFPSINPAPPSADGQPDTAGRLQITGNEAVAFGFLAAGGRFFTGYPITPATDVMVWLQRWLPKFGGVVRQAEDELAAVNMAIGAALTGVRSATATSGPGIALMQEGIGHAGSAEIPLVIIDCQRAGPSTGLPTKPEQSDLDLMVFGSNGEFPHIVLTPGHPQDCFDLAIAACNLAQRYQLPVFIALDQALSQNLATVEPFDLDAINVDQGKRLTADDLAKLDTYQRYAITDDGVSPYSVPSTPGGLSLITGNERDQFGHVSTDPANRVQMVDKRTRKLETAFQNGDLPDAHRSGDPTSTVGVIAIGSAAGAVQEATQQLREQGITTRSFQPRTVWPMLPETIEFVESCERVYVVEHNATAQLAKLLIREGAPADRIRSVNRYDGLPLRPDSIAQEILSREQS